MRIINVTVRDKIAVNHSETPYVCGNSDYVIHFDLDDEWSAYETKTARFKWGGKHHDVMFDGTECPVPKITDVCVFEVGVFADDLHTTTPATVPAKKSILCGGGVPAAPAEDVYNQIMARLDNLYIVTIKGGKSDRTQEEIRTAVAAGKTCLLVYAEDGRVFTYYGEIADTANEPYTDLCPTFAAPLEYSNNVGLKYRIMQVRADGSMSYHGYSPAKTPNPYKLTLMGAVNATYDGSKQVSVEIPKPPLYVTATIGEPYSENYFRCTFDKTGEEVVEAVKAGQSVMCLLSSDGGANVIPLAEYQTNGHATYLMHTAELTVTIDQNDDTTGGVRIEMAEATPETTPLYEVQYLTYATLQASNDNPNEGTAIMDGTFADAMAAVQARKIVRVHFGAPGTGAYATIYLPLVSARVEELVFESTRATLVWKSDDTATWTVNT